jgi:hypothetical protein
MGIDSDAAISRNVDNTISGAGKLGNGQFTLDNEAGGNIDDTGSEALVIDCKRLTSSPCEASIASITLNIDAPRQGRCCPEQVAR